MQEPTRRTRKKSRVGRSARTWQRGPVSQQCIFLISVWLGSCSKSEQRGFARELEIISGITIQGSNKDDFQVTVTPAALVPREFYHFSLKFVPSAWGSRTAVISIINDDSDENPYTFAVQGTGITVPKMRLEGNSLEIADTTPLLRPVTSPILEPSRCLPQLSPRLSPSGISERQL